MPNTSRIKPLLKWAGSKYKLIDRLLPHFPNNMDRLIEPFVGSAAVSLQFPQIRGVVGDQNMALARFHAIVAGLEPREILLQAAQLDKQYNRLHMEAKHEFYYAMRDEFNGHVRQERETGSSDRIRTGMLLWFLNKSCYNGLWRENRAGKFNVPFGWRESLNLAGHDVESVHKALQNKSVVHADFTTTIRRAWRGTDVIYADPPYHTESGAFTSYTGTFGEEEHRQLAAELRSAWERRVTIIASNSDTELVRELYGDWASMIEVEAPTSISRNPDSRGMRKELIIVAKHT